jgi:hypothetical protein
VKRPTGTAPSTAHGPKRFRAGIRVVEASHLDDPAAGQYSVRRPLWDRIVAGPAATARS